MNEESLARHAKGAKQNKRERSKYTTLVRASGFDSYLCELRALCEIFLFYLRRACSAYDRRRSSRRDAEIAEVQRSIILFLCVSAFSARHLLRTRQLITLPRRAARSKP